MSWQSSQHSASSEWLPSTPGDQSVGVIAGLNKAGLDPAEAIAFVHGTTVGINAVLERKGAACRLVTTQGFRDTLELGRRIRPTPYGMIGTFEPLISRERRIEVPERIDAAGRMLVLLDEKALRAAIQSLIASGSEALVIDFLHSYANPIHELMAAEIAREMWPNP
jgi:N-methylhydantoinase A